MLEGRGYNREKWGGTYWAGNNLEHCEENKLEREEMKKRKV